MPQRLWTKTKERSTAQADVATTVDDNVAKEAKRVDHLCSRGLVARGLTKVYGFFRSRPAVDGINFAVNQGEYFGLVGTGKSSLVGMLGGELFPTSENAFLQALSLRHHYRKWMWNIGYAPYNWGILETFTGREMVDLLLFSLRGVRDVPRTMAHVLQAVELPEPDANVPTYSGEAKTQLSLALIANPRV